MSILHVHIFWNIHNIILLKMKSVTKIFIMNLTMKSLCQSTAVLSVSLLNFMGRDNR
jgi:hypothetical protein